MTSGFSGTFRIVAAAFAMAAASAAAGGGAADAKPVALVGGAGEGKAFQHDLLAGERIRAVRFFGKDNRLAAAAGDAEILARVAFLSCAVRFARENLILYRKWTDKAPDYRAARSRFYSFVKAEVDADPLAMSPIWLVTGMYRQPYLNDPR